jgi:phage/plasmid primase-like uncharacterized protein
MRAPLPFPGGGVNGLRAKPLPMPASSRSGSFGWRRSPCQSTDHEQLAVAEGIETALSVQQITNLPTVAALSAAGMRSLRWPPQVRRLWIAADNDEVGRGAAEVLLERALRAGLQAHIKLPARGKNDFNDLLMSA